MFRSTSDPDARRRHRDLRRGPGPGDMPFGFRGIFGRGGWGRGGVGRGGIRPLILAVLSVKPMHGYEVIQALEAQSGGRWRPSAGSIYPALQQFADEGLVTSEEVDGRRTYTLTDKGRAAAATNPPPRRWTQSSSDDGRDLQQLWYRLMEAVMQVQRTGSAHAREETIRILTDARRQVYRLLADDEGEPAPDDGPDRP